MKMITKSSNLILTAIFLFVFFNVNSSAAINYFISGEVGGNSATSRLETQNLMNSWSSEADRLGCDIVPASISSPFTGNTMNISSNGIPMTITTRNLSDTFYGTLGNNVDIFTGATLQSNSPRPANLYNISSQPAYWADTTGSNSNKNAVLFEFTSPIRGFGAWFGDLETSNLGAEAIIKIFDNAGNQIGSDHTIPADTSISGVPSSCGGSFVGCGNSTTRFVGFWSLPSDNVYKVLVVVGDDDAGGNGNTERLSFIGPMIPNNCGYNLGNQVWNDKNNNGIYESGELGISGVTLNLYNDLDNSNSLTSGDIIASDLHGNLVSSIQTDSNGKYLFENLSSGNYIVSIDKSTVPVQYEISSNTITDPDDDINNDNNGLYGTVFMPNYSSRGINLSLRNEPINDQDTLLNGIPVFIAPDDDNTSNLTVDFGFFTLPKVTINKIVENGKLGTLSVSDFPMKLVNNDTGQEMNIISGQSYYVPIGNWKVQEQTNTSYNGFLTCPFISNNNEKSQEQEKKNQSESKKSSEESVLGVNNIIQEFYIGSLTPNSIINCSLKNSFLPSYVEITKEVIGGEKAVNDFHFSLTNSDDATEITNPVGIKSGDEVEVRYGNYTLAENSEQNYVPSYYCEIGTYKQEEKDLVFEIDRIVNSNTFYISPNEYAYCKLTNTYSMNSLLLKKTSVTNSYSNVGDIIEYNYQVTNMGTHDVHDLIVFDDKIANIQCPSNYLAINASMNCKGIYSTTLSDLQHGKVKNIAYASAKSILGVATHSDSVELEISKKLAATGKDLSWIYFTTNILIIFSASTLFASKIFRQNSNN